jgi:hypothetical protein
MSETMNQMPEESFKKHVPSFEEEMNKLEELAKEPNFKGTVVCKKYGSGDASTTLYYGYKGEDYGSGGGGSMKLNSYIDKYADKLKELDIEVEHK